MRTLMYKKNFTNYEINKFKKFINDRLTVKSFRGV